MTRRTPFQRAHAESAGASTSWQNDGSDLTDLTETKTPDALVPSGPYLSQLMISGVFAKGGSWFLIAWVPGLPMVPRPQGPQSSGHCLLSHPLSEEVKSSLPHHTDILCVAMLSRLVHAWGSFHHEFPELQGLAEGTGPL